MRHFLKPCGRWVRTHWFWPLVLVALPDCRFDPRGVVNSLDPGPTPHSQAIMCDIEKFQDPTRRCATAQDLAMGVALASAAEALVTGQHSSIGLDYSSDALAACGGQPQAIDYQGSFPDGYAVCLNCGAVIPALQADATAVCVAQCLDLIKNGPDPKPADKLDFCTRNAHPSTNFPTNGCFDNACSDAGTLNVDFVDPRRVPEAVVWTDLIGTTAIGNSLTRSAAPTGTFDAGAVSTQWVHRGDAFVEGEASETTTSHVMGLQNIPAACAFPCTDSAPGVADIDFAISLNVDGRFYVLEGGSLIAGPDINGSFGTYAAGQRFRVKLTDKLDGTATVSYSRVDGPCVPGNPCPDTVFYTHTGSPAVYPVRVDTSFREQPATLATVTFVRIQ